MFFLKNLHIFRQLGLQSVSAVFRAVVYIHAESYVACSVISRYTAVVEIKYNEITYITFHSRVCSVMCISFGGGVKGFSDSSILKAV